jgi:5-methylcytosine-specific restriction endonuclease McrA
MLGGEAAMLRPGGAMLTSDQVHDARREATQDWRAWYRTREWRRLRWRVLVAAAFTCAMCNRLTGDTSKLVADHIEPHRGDAKLFWDEGNVQCLCKACHDGEKQRAERAQQGRR